MLTLRHLVSVGMTSRNESMLLLFKLLALLTLALLLLAPLTLSAPLAPLVPRSESSRICPHESLFSTCSISDRVSKLLEKSTTYGRTVRDNRGYTAVQGTPQYRVPKYERWLDRVGVKFEMNVNGIPLKPRQQKARSTCTRKSHAPTWFVLE